MLAIFDIFLSSSSAVLTVLLGCALGYYAVHSKIAPESLPSILSNLQFHILLPIFLFLKVAAAVTAHRLSFWWPILVVSIIHILVSFGVARCIVFLLRFLSSIGLQRQLRANGRTRHAPSPSTIQDQAQDHTAAPKGSREGPLGFLWVPVAVQRVLEATITWSNSGNIPFQVFPVAVLSSPGIFSGFHGVASDLAPEERAVTYIAIYLVVWNCVSWTWGISRLRRPHQVPEDMSLRDAFESERRQRQNGLDAGLQAHMFEMTTAPAVPSDAESTSTFVEGNCSRDLEAPADRCRREVDLHAKEDISLDDDEESHADENHDRRSLLSSSMGVSSSSSDPAIATATATAEDAAGSGKKRTSRFGWMRRRNASTAGISASGSADTAARRLATRKAMLKNVFSPPTLANACGTIVGLIPVVKSFLLTDPPPIWNAVVATAYQFSDAFLAISMLTLGSSLANTHRKQREQRIKEKELEKQGRHAEKQQPVVTKTIVAASLIGKLVISPLINFCVTILLWWVIVPTESRDPVLLFMLLAETTCPGAMNLGTQSIIHKYGTDEVSTLLFYQYIAAVPAMTVWIAVILAIVPSLL
eukprot:ANDGO_04438.mRNA.1 Protein PIN-LIKES 5